MDYAQEFMAQFVCEVPEYLPAELEERVQFLSCLMEKESRTVYLCRDQTTGEKAILKVAEPGSPDSISREYFLLQKLDNPAIPRALLYSRDDAEREYLLRAYAEGETLDRLVERDGAFDERRTLEIIQKVCTILSYLHSQSPPIIYRDLKPQNIVMTPNGKISLIDFGISREEDPNKEFDTIYVGSIGFAAPEQFGFSQTDSRSDVFALGKLMLYLCTGQAKMSDMKSKVPSRRLVKLISKCTQLSPERRFASVDKLSRVIGRALNPPTGKEMLLGGAAALAVVVAGLCFVARGIAPQTAAGKNAPVSAEGFGYQQQVQIPVLMDVQMNGKAFADCAVAVDNHHWFAPAQEGQAELMVYAFDDYKARAAYQNQTAVQAVSVTKEGRPYHLTLDLGKVPASPELLQLDFPFGQRQEARLDIERADEVNLTGQPEGLSVEAREDGFYLVAGKNIMEPGHYTLFMEAVNEYGKADTVLALVLEEEKPVVEIATLEELAAMRKNLSGRYRLTADIDMKEVADWKPIGSADYPFTGVLDGAGHEIKGFSLITEAGNVGLFGTVNKGVIRNLIVREPDISVHVACGSGFGILVGNLENGLIENCAVLGGGIRADIGLESSAGAVAGISAGMIRNCFSSAEVTIFTTGSKERTEAYAGGICGTSNGYVENCGNVGDITGISIAGGVAGFNDKGIMTRCYNAGAVRAPDFAGSYPRGGLAHLLGRGKCIRYCAFEEGTAPVGTTVFNGGTMLGIIPLRKKDFESMEHMGEVFHLEAPGEHWQYVAQVPGYPVPRGIFAES